MLRHDVPRHDPAQRKTQPPAIKAIIKAEYQAHPDQVKALFLFGHVPIPYSGVSAPDGHYDHLGPWPSDTYYGDMNGLWTDTQDFSNNCNPALPNVPGDGNFDQIFIPAPLQLQVGRVDLFAMPAFAPRGEVELLRGYLNKDHAFRTRRLPVQRAAAAIGWYPLDIDDRWNVSSLCPVAIGANHPGLALHLAIPPRHAVSVGYHVRHRFPHRPGGAAHRGHPHLADILLERIQSLLRQLLWAMGLSR